MSPGPDDIVVLVLGPVGHGKSTFINQILGRQVAKTDDGYSPCTRQADGYRTEIPQRPGLSSDLEGKPLILVDTLGFETPDEVFKSINCVNDWLKSSSFDANWHIGGVVYVYPASRWTGMNESKEALSESLSKVCGKDAAANIVVATTRWDIIPPQKSAGRKAELATIFAGMDVKQLDNSREARKSADSAWTILEPVLNQCVQWRKNKPRTRTVQKRDQDGTHGGGCC